MMFKSLLTRTVAIHPSRSFVTSRPLKKSVTESVKETADTVNKKVGRTIASGLGDPVDPDYTSDVPTSKTAKAADSAYKAAEATRQDINHKTAYVKGRAEELRDSAEDDRRR